MIISPKDQRLGIIDPKLWPPRNWWGIIYLGWNPKIYIVFESGSKAVIKLNHTCRGSKHVASRCWYHKPTSTSPFMTQAKPTRVWSPRILIYFDSPDSMLLTTHYHLDRSTRIPYYILYNTYGPTHYSSFTKLIPPCKPPWK